MSGAESVSHIDILLALAKVDGKIDALTTAMAEKRADIAGLDTRVRALEQRPPMAPWVIAAMGGVAVIAFFLPFVIDAMNPQIQLLPDNGKQAQGK